MKKTETLEGLVTISLKRTQIMNEFKEKMKESYIYSSIEMFQNICSDYGKHYSETYPEKNDADKKEAVITLIGQSVLEFIRTSNFNENKIDDYINILGTQLHPACFAFLLWTQGKRDATFSVFKNHEINIDDEIYESVLTLFKPSNYRRLAGEDIERQQAEFLYYQKNYVLLEELQKLPKKEKSIKKLKI